MDYVPSEKFFQQVTLLEVSDKTKERLCKVVSRQLPVYQPRLNELPAYVKGTFYLLRRETCSLVAVEARIVLQALAEYFAPSPESSLHQKLVSLYLHL